jgi:hypothetical protein
MILQICRLLLLRLALDFNHVTHIFVLLIGIYMCVEYGKTINIADIWRNSTQIFNLLLIWNPFLENVLSLALQLAEHIEDEIVQISNCQFGFLAQLLDVVLYDILCLHIQLVYMCPLEVVAKLRFFLRGIKFIFGWILTGRHKDNGLVQSHQGLHPLLAFEYPLAQSLNALVLFLTLLHVAFRDGTSGIGEGMKVA